MDKNTETMEHKFKTPNIAFQNVISFTCSDAAVKPLLELFSKLRSLGQMGGSREVTIDWDGDGRERLENISVNGVTLDAWKKEFERLNQIRTDSEKKSSSEQELSTEDKEPNKNPDEVSSNDNSNDFHYSLEINGINYVTSPKTNDVWRCTDCNGHFNRNLCELLKKNSFYNCSTYDFIWKQNAENEKSFKITNGKCMICGNDADIEDGWICKDCRKL